MLPLRAEGTDVARAIVDEPVADHLVLALEAFAAFGARTACYGAVVWTVLAVDVLVRAGKAVVSDIVRDMPQGRGFVAYFRRYCVWKLPAVQSGTSHLNGPSNMMGGGGG